MSEKTVEQREQVAERICFGWNSLHGLTMLHTLGNAIIHWECECGSDGKTAQEWKEHLHQI
jgi:hypothetical protein